MTRTDGLTPAAPATRVRVARRRLEFHGEIRANLCRLGAIAVFYAIQLVNYYGLQLGFLELPRVAGVDADFHTAMTALAVAWTVFGLAVQFALNHRVFPAGMKYLTTGVDIVMLTSVLMIADGPASPMVVGYLLIIPLAGLRGDLTLVRLTTVCAVGAYLYLNGYARWFAVRDLAVPRYEQLIMIAALALTGVPVGQMVRQFRRFGVGGDPGEARGTTET